MVDCVKFVAYADCVPPAGWMGAATFKSAGCPHSVPTPPPTTATPPPSPNLGDRDRDGDGVEDAARGTGLAARRAAPATSDRGISARIWRPAAPRPTRAGARTTTSCATPSGRMLATGGRTGPVRLRLVRLRAGLLR